jgi:asparagine synthase (glutamine-hydrolysing)
MTNEMLRKLDFMTMAYSVEGRVPFAAPSVINHANRLQYSQLIRGKSLKWVLREAYSDILPKSILSRAKHGFNVPIDHWLRGEWSDLVSETFSRDSALFKTGLISATSYDEAKKMLSDNSRLSGHTIFCFVVLNRWLENEYAC